MLVCLYSLPWTSITCTVWRNLSTSVLQAEVGSVIYCSVHVAARQGHHFHSPSHSVIKPNTVLATHIKGQVGTSQEIRQHETKQDGKRVWFSWLKHVAPPTNVCSWPQMIDLAPEPLSLGLCHSGSSCQWDPFYPSLWNSAFGQNFQNKILKLPVISGIMWKEAKN